MSDPSDLLVEHLERLGSGHLLVVTGAGISLASGIPTFRGSDPGAVWTRDVTELGTLRYFLEDPVGSWRWYLQRFSIVFAAAPNPAHRALAALEQWHQARGGRFLLVTQNVDLLHELAGSQQLVKVHGSADRLRCIRRGCRFAAPRGSLRREPLDLAAFLREPAEATLPRCPECASLLRQHVLWFDETYDSHADYRFGDVEAAIATTDLVLCVGTSFSVGITELILQGAAWRQVPVLSIDPSGRAPRIARSLAAPAEELLPEVCRRLGAESTGTE